MRQTLENNDGNVMLLNASSCSTNTHNMLPAWLFVCDPEESFLHSLLCGVHRILSIHVCVVTISDATNVRLVVERDIDGLELIRMYVFRDVIGTHRLARD